MKSLILLAVMLLTLSTVAVQSSECARDKFKCKEGECIFESWICDGHQDCSNGNDEKQCGHCKVHNFQCSSGPCIENSRICDGKLDCQEGEDESSCGTACYSVEFTCSNGQCIPSHLMRCDGKNDCTDGSDELKCDKKSGCSAEDFRCSNGACIKSSWLCDGDSDCNDGEDERNCSLTTTASPTCPSNQTTCPDGGCASSYISCLLYFITVTSPPPNLKPQSISSNTTETEGEGTSCVLGEGCLVKVMAIVFSALAIVTLSFIGSFCLRYRKKARAGENQYLPLSRQQETNSESITMSNVL